ncbi:cyclase family protein [Leifsonia shinshuensis]|uniref:cyclase family protein n=1 Tax=Leifsonia shinshuensis TaxID=150026 RepID=UPI001F504E06|nr:cyclase family protein [Leifsonia shinshuensis]MCI0157260.1 cyclase family protein [Leifsonia shinshuensis]
MRFGPFVDLSRPLGADTDVYPGDPEVRLEPHATIEVDGYNLLAVHLGSQSGTHVDAPFHFSQGGARVDELPLALFAGPAVIVDAGDPGPRGRIGRRHLDPLAGRLRAGVVLLFRTGWSSRYGTAAYHDHPFLDPEACAWALDRGIRTFGIDAPSIDETPATASGGDGYPCHRLIAAAGGVICENLTRLEDVTFDDPVVSLFPIPLQGADGAPVRAVAYRVEG